MNKFLKMLKYFSQDKMLMQLISLDINIFFTIIIRIIEIKILIIIFIKIKIIFKYNSYFNSKNKNRLYFDHYNIKT